MFNMPFVTFSLFTCIQIVNLHFVMFSANKNTRLGFVLFGIGLLIIHFMLYFNVLDYSYSDDLFQYIKWFTYTAGLDNVDQIDLQGKDPGFSYLLYFLSRFFDSPGFFVFLLSSYVVLFSLFISMYASSQATFENHMRAIFLLLTLILLNRLSLSHYSSVIRSFLCSSLIIFCYFKYLDKRYIWCLLLPFLFFIHKFQFILFFVLLTGAYFTSIKILLIGLVLSIINLPFGYFAAFFIEQITLNIDALKSIYQSRILTEEMRFTLARKFQIFSLVVFPLICVMRATTEKWKFTIATNEFDRKVIKLTVIASICFFLLVEVLPGADRFLVFVLPLLYVMFIKHCSRNTVYIFSLLSILLSFIAMQRNLDNLIL
jgi:hypothetical protein